MKRIFIAGAGLSSSSLIRYLLEKSETYEWNIVVGDLDLTQAEKKINGHKNGSAVYFDVQNAIYRDRIVSESDLVISLLPVNLHKFIVESCIKSGTDLLTASYASNEINSLNALFLEKGMSVIYECGLDPGLDHMSAMKIIDGIKRRSATLISFKSSTGGLVAPEFDNNPWNYKFTWNPRNVVLAGKDGAQYLEKGQIKNIPYQQLFKQAEQILVEGEKFETYANRDSLRYQSIYSIENAETVYRGTIRKSGFCGSWDHLVQLGLTDESPITHRPDVFTYRQLMDSVLYQDPYKSTESKVAEQLSLDENSQEMKKLEWLDLFSQKLIPTDITSRADALLYILKEKWKLMPDETDMIVMQHEFIYQTKDNELQKTTSTLVYKGQDTIHTAMSQTVGLPLGITARLLMTGKIKKKGLLLPVSQDIYQQVLDELKEFGIEFVEKEEKIR